MNGPSRLNDLRHLFQEGKGPKRPKGTGLQVIEAIIVQLYQSMV